MAAHLDHPSLADALMLYRIEHLATRNLARLTRVAYIRDVEDFIAWLAETRPTDHPVRVDAVSRRDLERYLCYLDDRSLAVAYRRRKVAALRSFFGFLHEREILPHSPADPLIPPAKQLQPPRVLTKAKYTRLLQVVRHETRDRAIIEGLLQTGLRLSELAHLHLADVVLPTVIRPPDPATRDPGTTGTLTVRGTGHTPRTITLNWKACTALRASLAVRPTDAEDDHLFVTKFRRGMGHRGIQRVVEKYLTRAGITDASVQSLRHTFAMHQTRQGTPLGILRQALGHASPTTTTISLDVAPDVMQKALQDHAL